MVYADLADFDAKKARGFSGVGTASPKILPRLAALENGK